MATRIVLTYADYAAIPNDGKRYELHEGDLSVTPAPGTRHQRAVLNLVIVVTQHVRDRHLGEVFVSPVDCILSETTVVQPDIVYVENERLTAVSERGIEGPPTLVVEVLSPSTIAIDRTVKGRLYAKHRVPYYWIVDGDPRTVQAFEPSGDAYRPVGTVQGERPVALPPFPDLPLDPAAIWP
jgi:Uma2 family endonuclease